MGKMEDVNIKTECIQEDCTTDIIKNNVDFEHIDIKSLKQEFIKTELDNEDDMYDAVHGFHFMNANVKDESQQNSHVEIEHVYIKEENEYSDIEENITDISDTEDNLEVIKTEIGSATTSCEISNKDAKKKSKKVLKFTCDICQKQFVFQYQMNRHMRKHTGEKNFECNICHMKFIYQQNLYAHMKTHTERLFQCNECNKKFLRPFDLKRHIKTHTDERSFACDDCKKTFINKHNYDAHMQSPSEIQLECKICSEKFVRSTCLKTHMMIHSGGKIYDCNLCGKKFARVDARNLHVKIHTGEKRFNCLICNREFNYKFVLQRHMLTHSKK